MKKTETFLLWGVIVFGLLEAGPTRAQELIYRCGNEYSNQKPQAVPGQPLPACTVLQGVGVTEIKSPKSVVRPIAPAPATGVVNQAIQPEAVGQNQEAKAILEAEWVRAQTQRQELLAQYQNGSPPLLGGEAHNHQKYLDRVAELKRQLDRNEADLNSLQHELNRIR